MLFCPADRDSKRVDLPNIITKHEQGFVKEFLGKIAKAVCETALTEIRRNTQLEVSGCKLVWSDYKLEMMPCTEWSANPYISNGAELVARMTFTATNPLLLPKKQAWNYSMTLSKITSSYGTIPFIWPDMNKDIANFRRFIMTGEDKE